MNSEHKNCRHCLSEMPRKARRCVHCHSFQSWIATQSDPRFFAGFIGIFALMFVMVTVTSLVQAIRGGIAEDQVAVISYHVVLGTDDTTLAVLLSVRCPKAKCRSGAARFQVDISDASGKIVDSFQACEKLLVKDGEAEFPLRVTGTIVVKPEEIAGVTARANSSSFACRRDGV